MKKAHKTRTSITADKKKGRLPIPSAKKEQAIPGQVLKEVWRSEVESLRSGFYTSYEQAAGLLIDKVVDRLSLKGKEKEDCREFLKFIFNTDEGLRQEIIETLRIR